MKTAIALGASLGMAVAAFCFAITRNDLSCVFAAVLSVAFLLIAVDSIGRTT